MTERQNQSPRKEGSVHEKSTQKGLANQQSPEEATLPEQPPLSIAVLKESLRSAKKVLGRARNAKNNAKVEFVDVTIGNTTHKVPYTLKDFAEGLIAEAQTRVRALAKALEIREAEEARIKREKRLEEQKKKEKEKQKPKSSENNPSPLLLTGEEVLGPGKGEHIIFSVQVRGEEPLVTTKRPLSGSSAELIRTTTQDLMEDGELSPDITYGSYFRFTPRKGELESKEIKNDKVPLGKLLLIDNFKGFDVVLLSDDEINELIQERAKVLGKKNQIDFDYEIRLLLDALQKPELGGTHRLKQSKMPIIVNGKRKSLFRFSPAEIVPKLPFKYRNESERIRIAFCVHQIEGTRIRIPIDIINHDLFDKKYALGLESHR